jgi:hypothetical protein
MQAFLHNSVKKYEKKKAASQSVNRYLALETNCKPASMNC